MPTVQCRCHTLCRQAFVLLSKWLSGLLLQGFSVQPVLLKFRNIFLQCLTWNKHTTFMRNLLVTCSQNTHQMSVSLQRIDIRLSLLQSAVDEYNKAKNDFAAKVSLFWTNSFKKIIKSLFLAALPVVFLSLGHWGWDETPAFSTKAGWGERRRTAGCIFAGNVGPPFTSIRQQQLLDHSACNTASTMFVELATRPCKPGITLVWTLISFYIVHSKPVNCPVLLLNGL